METIPAPTARPANPCFSSGPCAKIPGWTPGFLENALLGRSHRAAEGKARLKLAISLTREILEVPPDHLIGIVPASDTGAVEMALWSLLGARGVDMLSWESFGKAWIADAVEQLKLDDVRLIEAEYGALPDLNLADTRTRDCVFTWNGTTSGVRVPDANWIASDREGLTVCDATSAVFAQNLDWAKLDVVTYSWQKVLGGEAAHGMLILGPRAVERLESHEPPWPLPKIFRLTKAGKLDAAIFEGATINTPSMLCVEDYIHSLQWAGRLGGLGGLIARADANAAAIDAWVAQRAWIEHLAREPTQRSNTSVCLKLSAEAAAGLSDERAAELPGRMAALLDEAGVAHDIGAYRDAPPGLRIWCGATVETRDVEALLPWLDWSHARASAELS